MSARCGLPSASASTARRAGRPRRGHGRDRHGSLPLLDGRPRPDVLVALGGRRHEPGRREARAWPGTTRTSSRAPSSVEPRSTARSTSIARAPPTSGEGSSDFSPGEPRSCSRGLHRPYDDGEARLRVARRQRPRAPARRAARALRRGPWSGRPGDRMTPHGSARATLPEGAHRRGDRPASSGGLHPL